MNHTSNTPRFRLSASLATAGLLTLSAATTIGASPAPEALPDASDGCWTDTPGVVGEIDHPTDPLVVVLRMTVGGGFVPPEVAFMEAPTFTLYGNDVVIFRPSGQQETLEEPLLPFACTRLAPEQVDELLRYALDEIGLREAVERYPNPFIADAPSTIFTIDADGVRKDIVVEALGFDSPAEDVDARARFQTLSERLSAFDAAVDGAPSYDVPLYAAMLTPAWAELEGTVIAWPWEDVALGAFGEELDIRPTLTPEQVAAVAAEPNGGQTFILLETPEGERVILTIRPLLPDEVVSAA